MKRRLVHTGYIAALVAINKDTFKEIQPLELNRGALVDKVRVVVNEACDAGTLQLKMGGVNLGSSVDLKTVGVTEIAGKGVTVDFDELEYVITGDITSGNVDAFTFMFLPSREKKSI